jgi:hypothetical protein
LFIIQQKNKHLKYCRTVPKLGQSQGQDRTLKWLLQDDGKESLRCVYNEMHKASKKVSPSGGYASGEAGVGRRGG